LIDIRREDQAYRVRDENIARAAELAGGLMEADEYTRLAQQESLLWWFGLLHRNLFASLDALGLSKPGLKCADFGCGTGGFVAKLQKRFPTWSVVGLDRSQAAVKFARQNHGPYFVSGDVQQPPFPANSFDVVFSIDVMCTREVEPERMLKGIFTILKPGGFVILNNPAYEWLRSYHDVFVHSARRYTTDGVAADLASAGFTVARCTYWNTILFPLMVLKRKVLTGSASHSDVAEIPNTLNWMLSLVSLPEPALMRYGINLPFGGSVLSIGRKIS
jgi:SAM-dependent methyltransferase